MDINGFDWVFLALKLCVLVISLSLHAWGHAFVACKLGDRTPYDAGRLTLNPLAHIDRWGTLLFPLFTMLLFSGVPFGWGKSVPIGPENFTHPKRDRFLVYSAGIFLNFLLVFTGACMLAFDSQTTFVAITLLQVNALLIVFNLLPLPGLDGFELLRPYLSVSARTFLVQWAPCILLLIIFLPPINQGLSFLMNTIIVTCCQVATELHRLW